jgi:lysophospholipase L1-like esterase
MTTDQRSWLRAGVSVAAYLAACAGLVLMSHGPLIVRVVAVFAVGLLASRLQRVVRHEFGYLHDKPRHCWMLIAGVFAIGAVMALIWLLWHNDGVGFCGLALLYVAVGLGLEELRSRDRLPAVRFVAVLAVAGGLALAGLGAAALGQSRGWWVFWVAVLLAPIGIALVSELGLNGLAHQSVPQSLVVGGAGAVFLAIGVGGLVVAGLGATYVLALGAFLVVLLVGIAARSNTDVVFVVVVAAVVWTLGHRSVPEPAALSPGADDDVVVALGDSFISGEGADEFFDGTNITGINTCRRAPTAYPVTTITERGVVDVPDRLEFLACSGAKTIDIDAQVDQLVAQLGSPDDDIAFVLLSVGGNDALFGTIGRACLLPVDCTVLQPAVDANLVSVEASLDDLYAQLRSRLGDVPVVVVPYPDPLAPHGCAESAFSDAEHEFLHSFATSLDSIVARSAARAGFPVVDTMPTALAGLRLCDGPTDEAGVNFLGANSVAGTLEQSLNPTRWVHNSLHPNARGHEAMRSALVAWLAGSPDLRPTPAEPPTPPRVAAPSGAECLGRTADDLNDCANAWTSRHAAAYVLTRGWLLIPALVGAWLIALQLIRLWRVVFDDPDRPSPPPGDQSGRREFLA